MLNPVSNAIKEIMMTIPVQILNVAFSQERYGVWTRKSPQSLDEAIRSKVIYARVMKDCNLIGGRHIYVYTENLPYYEQDTFTLVFEIPMVRTGNREIIGVLSVNYLPHSAAMGTMGTPYGSVNPVTQSDAETVGQRVADSYSNVPHISTAHAELIGFNTISIRDQMRSTVIFELRCIVANEENLSNLQPRSYKAFADACKLACKSWIYNQLIIKMDQGILEQGQALGEFKTMVDKYEQAEEQYQEFLTNKMQKILFMNDVMSMDRFISIQVNPGL